MTVPAAAIEALGLSKRYGGTTVLRDISFTLPVGSKTALIGSNGAGKTTLLSILSTLVVPSGGEVRVAGYGLSEGPKLRASIGVLAHRPMLYEELTPLENLAFFARLYTVDQAEQRIEELLRRVGLWHRRDEPTAVLSRGYHQRLSIARALVHQPPVLLLDEPETGLDLDATAMLDELVLRAPEITVLSATHHRDRIEVWADGLLELDRGVLRGEPVEDVDVAGGPGSAAQEHAAAAAS